MEEVKVVGSLVLVAVIRTRMSWWGWFVSAAASLSVCAAQAYLSPLMNSFFLISACYSQKALRGVYLVFFSHNYLLFLFFSLFTNDAWTGEIKMVCRRTFHDSLTVQIQPTWGRISTGPPPRRSLVAYRPLSYAGRRL